MTIPQHLVCCLGVVYHTSPKFSTKPVKLYAIYFDELYIGLCDHSVSDMTLGTSETIECGEMRQQEFELNYKVILKFAYDATLINRHVVRNFIQSWNSTEIGRQNAEDETAAEKSRRFAFDFILNFFSYDIREEEEILKASQIGNMIREFAVNSVALLLVAAVAWRLFTLTHRK